MQYAKWAQFCFYHLNPKNIKSGSGYIFSPYFLNWDPIKDFGLDPSNKTREGDK